MTKLINLAKFTKSKKIGEGKSGTVYLLIDPEKKKQYAAKVYSKSCNRVSDRNLISNEFDKLSSVRNHAVLRVYYYSLRDFDKKPFPTIISDYIPRGSLENVLAGSLPTAQQKEWTLLKRYITAIGIACGMKYLHDNDIVHGDLNPSKVLLDNDFYPYIYGFLLNKNSEENSFLSGKPTDTKNPLYVAPEILLECSKCTKEADVYSYSMIAYELITGKKPFKSYNKTQLREAIQKGKRPEIPRNYEMTRVFFESCWCENPEQRTNFDSIIQFLREKQFKQIFKIFDDSEVTAYLNFFKRDLDISPSSTSILDIFNATIAKALASESEPEPESDDDASAESLKIQLKREKEERKLLERDLENLRKKNVSLETENNRLKEESYRFKEEKLKWQKLNSSLQNQLKEAKTKAKKEKEKSESEIEEKIEPVENIPKKKVKFLDLEELQSLNRVEKIGKGNSSKVYKVTRNEVLALKVFDTSEIEKKGTDGSMSGDEIVFDKKETEKKRKNLMYRFKHFIGEYEILNNLNHPNIIETYGFFLGDNDHRPSILLQYCPYNLSQAIKRISEIEKITIIYELSEAMFFVHMNNIIHRDLKPENILLDEFYHVKLSDFGISTLIEVETQTQQRTGGIGTIEFMAPELFDEKPEYDEKVDVYAFGIVMYYVLTNGQYPNAIKAAFARKQIEIPSSVNDFSKKLIQKCISVDPTKRPSFKEICQKIKDNNFLLFDGVESLKPDILSRLSELLE